MNTPPTSRIQESDQKSDFAKIVGKEIFEFIREKSPLKVRSRVNKSHDHYQKALKLKGHDEEMAAIRLIAAEEELVVAIFELLKLKSEKVPAHADFIKKFKNHRVKLAFYPVLSQFRWVLIAHFENGITLADLIDATVKLVIKDGAILLQTTDQNGTNIFNLNPLSIIVTQGDKTSDEVVDELFQDFSKHVAEQLDLSVKEFVLARANYRNKLLYAEDAGIEVTSEALNDLLPVFEQAFHDLLWVLAVLLGNDVPSADWGVASQFISLYRKVLLEAKLL